MIDHINLIKTKAILSKQFHLSPLDVDSMMYWEYELFIEELNNLVNEENDKQKGEMSQYNDMKSQYSPSKMGKMMPKYDMPKVNMPKF